MFNVMRRVLVLSSFFYLNFIDMSNLKRFHITYFLPEKDSPTLTGVTIEAEDIVFAIIKFIIMDETPGVECIKYCIEL